MLSLEAVGLIIKAAKGTIKLARRLDLVRAEQEAVEAPLALPVPQVGLAPTQPQMRSALRGLLQQTRDADPDPLGSDRAAIANAVELNPDNAVLFGFMQTYLPGQALGRVLDLDGAFVTALRKVRPDWAADPDLVVAAFYVGARRDERGKGYVWRFALTVVDVVAEFGADNVALFSRDEGVQAVVGAVLKRFGEADVQDADSTAALVRAALGATLDGVLDARADLRAGQRWLDALLDALAQARAALPEGKRDDFTVGLLRGRGYPALVAGVLEQGAGLLGDDAAGFESVAATFLIEVAGIVERQPSLRDFFQDHWGDLLRAGLSSAERHGPALLQTASPLVREVLVGVARALARSPDPALRSSDVLVGIVDAAISVVAANPDEVDRFIGTDWLATLIDAVASTVADDGIRAAVTRSGVERLVRDALAVFAAHPEMVVDRPGLARDLVQGVLTSLRGVAAFSAEALASAAVGGALTVMAERPEVLAFKYTDVVAALAGKVGALVAKKQLTKVQGAEILAALTEALAENPSLFLDLERGLAGSVVDAVLKAADASGGLLSGALLVQALREVVLAVAATGNAALENHPAGDLAEQLTKLLQAGLARAAEELGRRMSRRSLPPVLARLVRAWARGEVPSLDPNDDAFRRLFSDLVEQAAAP